MKRMLRRKVVLFGRSIPVAALLLAAVTTIALAGWAFATLTGNFALSAGADPYRLTVNTASVGSIINDTVPVQALGASVSNNGSSFTFGVSNASPGDTIAVVVSVHADAANAGPLYVPKVSTLLPPAWAGKATFGPTTMDGSNGCGFAIAPGADEGFGVLITIGSGLNPGEVLSSTPVILNFPNAVPSC